MFFFICYWPVFRKEAGQFTKTITTMATRELTYEELNDSLIDFLSRIHSFDFYLYDFFSNQFLTGIRYIELY